MTDNQYLEAILREQTLAPGSLELKELQQHRKEVETLIRESFGDSPVIREGGSKAKGTMIKENYDLDLTCYFPHEEDDAGQTIKEIYESVESTLIGKYAVTRKGVAIRITDAEDRRDFHIDVIPGRFVDGDDGDVFLYPSSGDKERLKTNLEVHIEHIRGSGVIDPIRLMKLWRCRNGITVKTFVLELLTIKLLESKKQKSLADQLLHVWEQLHDHSNEISIEDPANPEGNDLSELFNDAVKAELSVTAEKTLTIIDESGWEAVFGKVHIEDQERTEALKRISVASPTPSKPWFSGE